MKLKIIFFTILFASNCYAAIKNFHNEYENIIPGRSTLEDVIDNLGAPKSKIANSNNVKYIFEKVEVTIQDATGLVNTIIINNDYEFEDKNGVKLGDSTTKFENKTNRTVGDKSALGDCRNGYNYWFKNNKVDRIVLGHSMRCN